MQAKAEPDTWTPGHPDTRISIPEFRGMAWVPPPRAAVALLLRPPCVDVTWRGGNARPGAHSPWRPPHGWAAERAARGHPTLLGARSAHRAPSRPPRTGTGVGCGPVARRVREEVPGNRASRTSRHLARRPISRSALPVTTSTGSRQPRPGESRLGGPGHDGPGPDGPRRGRARHQRIQEPGKSPFPTPPCLPSLTRVRFANSTGFQPGWLA